jgi:GMP synthase (glutamine-hydrolysing)
MKIHCIRHEPFEGLACIEDWINENNHELSCTFTYLQQAFPSECSFDLLIIMGGTASIYESYQESWYLDEKRFLEDCINRNIKILGICLGAQILASILGSKIYPGKAKEIGWFPVEFFTSDLPGLNFFPRRIETFHWHGDTFDIPEGAVKLASSEITPNQGFVYKDTLFALQFHPEMTTTSLQKIIKAAGNDLNQKGESIQTAEQILSRRELISENNLLMFKLLDYMAKI